MQLISFNLAWHSLIFTRQFCHLYREMCCSNKAEVKILFIFLNYNGKTALCHLTKCRQEYEESVWERKPVSQTFSISQMITTVNSTYFNTDRLWWVKRENLVHFQVKSALICALRAKLRGWVREEETGCIDMCSDDTNHVN